jgi:hypothetical protein
MGTRSRIGVMHGNNCKSVYAHWDGYLDYNGRILQENYDSSKANHLVALGDLSSLKPEVFIPEGTEHSFEKPAENITVFYGRDRGETGTEWKTTSTFEEFIQLCDDCGAEYYYIMKDGEWYVGTTYGSDDKLGGKLVPLAEALANEVIDNAESHEKSAADSIVKALAVA